MLRYGHARAESMGVPIHFSQQDAEHTNFEDGVRYMEFCEAVAQSIYEGRTISMPPEPKMDSWGRPL